MKKVKTVIICLLLVPFIALGQESKDELTKKELRKNRPAYITIGTGLSFSKFRDLATSPLYYGAMAKQIGISRLRIDKIRESEFGISYLSGTYNAVVEENVTSSSLKSISLMYSKLYQIKKISNQKYNFTAGGMFVADGNFRMNEALQNNSLGLELFPSIMGSVKFSADISRKQLKNKRFLFFKYKLKPAKREFSYRLNVGVINASYRNGYAYTGQSSILNDAKLFDDYHFNVFSGYRFSSSLNYKKYLKSDNAIEFSYVWKAYSSNGEFEKFQMANHTMQFKLHFKTN